MRGDRCEVVHKLIPFGAYGKGIFRFTDFLEKETFRLRHKVVARNKRGKENPSKEHLSLEE